MEAVAKRNPIPFADDLSSVEVITSLSVELQLTDW
jgi:hypothetical protein